MLSLFNVYLLKTKAVGLMVSGEDFLSFSHYNSMETLDSRVGASLDPRGLIGRIPVGDH